VEQDGGSILTPLSATLFEVLGSSVFGWTFLIFIFAMEMKISACYNYLPKAMISNVKNRRNPDLKSFGPSVQSKESCWLD
jgi:hypothetical protein